MRRTYAIGDVHGCYEPLQRLLKAIDYNEKTDHLWFTGDLINRGAQSLETLRFIKQLPNVTCVLGNHDIAFLVSAHLKTTTNAAFLEILHAPDKDELIKWLTSQPLLHHDPKLGFTLVHAGIYPTWSLNKAQQLAKEVHSVLLGETPEFYHHLFGNEPHLWDEKLSGWERYRFIINAFTRLRFCDPGGGLNLTATGSPMSHPELIPWYDYPNRATSQEKILFGHWASLNITTAIPNIYPLDSGCVWGNALTAMHLETQERITVPARI